MKVKKKGHRNRVFNRAHVHIYAKAVKHAGTL